MKDSEKKPPLLPLLAACLACFSMSLWTFWWFVLNFSQLIEQFVSNASLIEFNKGAFYGLGSGIGLGGITYALVHQNILKFSLDNRFFNMMPAVMVFGVFISLLLPPIAHYSLEYILENRGYMICDLDSYQWRMYRTFYYVSDVDTCTNLIESKK